jgi:hypothetical protein
MLKIEENSCAKEQRHVTQHYANQLIATLHYSYKTNPRLYQNSEVKIISAYVKRENEFVLQTS